MAGGRAERADHKHGLLAVIANRRLLLLSVALALFNLGNGSMLSLVGQRLVISGYDATRWTAIYVVLAQLTMIPVAIFAGSSADKRGRRHLLLIACAALIVRAIVSALTTSPILLGLMEILDGVGSGLLGVCVPIAVADLTWGSGRTQTALGVVKRLARGGRRAIGALRRAARANIGLDRRLCRARLGRRLRARHRILVDRDARNGHALRAAVALQASLRHPIA